MTSADHFIGIAVRPRIITHASVTCPIIGSEDLAWTQRAKQRAARRQQHRIYEVAPVDRFLHSYVPWKTPFLNLRNHRKLLVVDGRIAFTGGINIGHENLLATNPPHPVRDTHFRLEGPIVEQLTEAFADDWLYETGERLLDEAWFPKLAPVGDAVARVITSGPDEDLEQIEFAILGAILNEETIPRLRCQIVAGAANNQLADDKRDGALLDQRGILYAPDFVINAGGLINVYNELLGGYNRERALRMTRGIYLNLTRVFETAKRESITTAVAADHVAEERIATVRKLGSKHWGRLLAR